MQFKYPEILYFLGLLIIPIVIHLFQLQKFQKVAFTNVAFLKKITHQTRKSSSIKKWLVLLTRLMLLSAILFAFAQPYFSPKNNYEKNHTFLYLDNSLSTNTTGKKGNLLKASIQNIIDNTSEDSEYTLLTNTDYFESISKKILKNKLISLSATSKKRSIETVLLTINEFKKNKKNTLNEAILITDLQGVYKNNFNNVTDRISIVKLTPSIQRNISIDSVYTAATSVNNTLVYVQLKNQGTAKNNIPIALYNNDTLVSKQLFSIDENNKKVISFQIRNTYPFLGKIKITHDDTFTFDNTFFFCLNTPKKINVLVVGNKAIYLNNIYTEDTFNVEQFSDKSLNYNVIQNQQLIILNELETISNTFAKSLVSFSKNGG